MCDVESTAWEPLVRLGLTRRVEYLYSAFGAIAQVDGAEWREYITHDERDRRLSAAEEQRRLAHSQAESDREAVNALAARVKALRAAKSGGGR